MQYYRDFKVGGYDLSDGEEAELAYLETVRAPVAVYGAGEEGAETASTLEDEVRALFAEKGGSAETRRCGGVEDSEADNLSLILALEEEDGDGSANGFSLADYSDATPDRIGSGVPGFSLDFYEST